MALTRTNTTVREGNPMGTSISFTPTTLAVSNRKLIILVASPVVDVVSVTYNSINLTQKFQQNTSFSTYWSVWELDNPPIGTFTGVVNFSTGQFNNVSIVAFSFSDCEGVGVININNTQAVGQSVTLVGVTKRSKIIGSIIGGANTSVYLEIPIGSFLPILWNSNINNFTWGGISNTIQVDGDVTVRGGNSVIPASNIALGIEVMEKTGLRRIIIT